MAHQLVYDFNSRSKNTMESRLRKILNRNPSVQLGIDFMVLNDQVAIAIRSSIDEMVSSELKRFLSESTLKLQKQIRSQLDHRTRKDQNSLTENLSKSQTRVKNIQSTYRKQLDEVLSVYEIKKEALEKEIEKREQKEKDKLEDKAKDLLDQIFNKKKKKKARKDTASTES